ncbi:MAG: copper oxidase, partial [Candidatus Electrothrix sp. AUS4]|nr:copper oxidase [Candidatus Electrothrix sp. AUS4]
VWWCGVANIIAKTVRAMEEHFGSSPQDLQAVISPSLGPCCAEFVRYKEELPEAFQQWQEPETYFDFWKISRWQLIEAGLVNEQIKATELCTVCNKDFFSFRRATKKPRQNGVTGRNGSVIFLPAA